MSLFKTNAILVLAKKNNPQNFAQLPWLFFTGKNYQFQGTKCNVLSNEHYAYNIMLVCLTI